MTNVFNYPKTSRPYGQIQTSVLVSPEFFRLAKERNIKFSEALRVGISLLLAEAGEIEYDNRLNVYRKMTLFQAELEKISKEFDEYKKKHESVQEEKDINDILNSKPIN